MGVAAPASLILPDGSEHDLGPQFTVGRADDCDLQLPTTTVSRQHALITTADDHWFVEDRGSFNGTLLNGARIQPGVRLPLRHGDRLGLGTETLVFSCPAQLEDPDRTTPLEEAPPTLLRPLSPFQQQVVRVLCESWLAGGTLEDLPSNEEIAARLGTPGATETVKAVLRRIYAKAGLVDQPAHAKRRSLCRVARQRGWI